MCKKVKRELVEKEMLVDYILNNRAFVEQQVLCLTYKQLMENAPRKRLERAQKDFLLAINSEKRVLVTSGRGTGTTAGIAFAVLWFLWTRPFSKVLLVGKKELLALTLWPEIKKWLRMSNLTDNLAINKNRLFCVGYQKTWFATIVPPSREALAGFSEKHIMIVVPHIGELTKEVHETIMSYSDSFDVKVVYVGTGYEEEQVMPILKEDGRYPSLWKHLRLNSEESGLVSEVWLNRMKSRALLESKSYRAFVRGLPSA